MVSDNLMRGNTISKSAHYFVCHNYQMESEKTEQTLLILNFTQRIRPSLFTSLMEFNMLEISQGFNNQY